MSKRILLVDGDVLVYRIGFASEKPTEWGDHLTTLHSDPTAAKDSMDAYLEHLCEWLKADQMIVALTCHDTPNFRKSFYPAYKENRTKTRKPMQWQTLRDHLLLAWNAKIKPNLEADDVLGILSTIPHKGQERIIVSIDKDFKTIPGLFFNNYSLRDDATSEVMEITEDEADANFMAQTLTGDTVDHYPGCAGVGPKKAASILGRNGPWIGMEEAYKRVKAAYDKAGFGEEFLLTQARCARILRYQDYDHTLKQPILWTPPTPGGDLGQSTEVSRHPQHAV